MIYASLFLRRQIVTARCRCAPSVLVFLLLGLITPSLAQQLSPKLYEGIRWRSIGPFRGGRTVAVTGVPGKPNVFYMAPNNGGVWKSDDYGRTWNPIFDGQPTGSIGALALAPSNPQIIYVGSGEGLRRPDLSVGDGIYKSSDGGANWKQLTGGLPTEKDKLGRIGIGIAPSDANRIYAWVDAPKLGGIYRSDDAGENWQRVNEEQRIGGRGDDFACVRVDPKNKDIVYAANTSTYRSADAGKNFIAIKGAPGGDDYHTIWINPENPDIIALASDQGLTLSVNGGQTWSSWYNQPTAQFYHVITDNQFPYWVYGGQQESGSAGTASRSDFGEITFREWYPVGTEEYGYVAPDPLDPNFIYGGKATRYDRTTGQTRDISPVVLRTGQYRFNRTAPLIFSAADPHALYLGSNVLFKTTNGGQSWDIISPDLTREDPGVPPNLGVFVGSDPAKGKHRGVIYSIAPSPKDANLIWIGTDDGLIQVTHDGGKNWQNATPPELTPWSKLAQMDASHFDTATVYAAVNRFRLDDLHPYIYRTHDDGKTWQKVVTGLPENEPVNTVREDPERKGLLFAGTERSVYFSFDDGDHWQSLQLNLPATSIRDLVIHQDDVVVGTHGRSFWILDNITPLRHLNTQVADADTHLFPPQLTHRMRRNNNTDTPLPPEEPAGQNPPDGAMLDYTLKSSAPVTLEIFDEAGKLVRRFSSTDKPEPVDPKELPVPTYWIRPPQILSSEPGMHRFVWDLHYPPPDSLEHEYPISAIYHDTPRYPLGPAVLPGNYNVQLTVAGKSYARPLIINIDHRSQTALDGLRQQFDTETKIADAMHRDYTALEEVRRLRAQLKPLQEKAKKPLSDSIADLDKKAAELEGPSGGYGAVFLKDAAGRSLARLSGGLNQLLGAVDGADAAPTRQQIAMLNQVQAALEQQLADWKELKDRDLPALNSQLRRAKLNEIIIKK